MALRRKRRLTHLVSQNKKIRIWHQRLGYASNIGLIYASKLVDEIHLDLDSEYNPEEVLIYLDMLSNKIKLSELKPTKLPELEDIEIANRIFARSVSPELGNINLANQTFDSHLHNFDFKDVMLCTICIVPKSTRVVKQYKSMMTTNKS